MNINHFGQYQMFNKFNKLRHILLNQKKKYNELIVKNKICEEK